MRFVVKVHRTNGPRVQRGTCNNERVQIQTAGQGVPTERDGAADVHAMVHAVTAAHTRVHPVVAGWCAEEQGGGERGKVPTQTLAATRAPPNVQSEDSPTRTEPMSSRRRRRATPRSAARPSMGSDPQRNMQQQEASPTRRYAQGLGPGVKENVVWRGQRGGRGGW